MPRKPRKTKIVPPTVEAPDGARVPKYRLYRRTGQAVVTLSGRDHYLGAYGSPESIAQYHETVARWLAGGRRPLHPIREADADKITVAEVLLSYVDDCERRFSGRRNEGRLMERIRAAVKTTRLLFGSTAAESFGPAALLTVRRAWIDRGLSRSTINDSVRTLRRAFRHAVRHELVSPTVWHGLLSVDALRQGESPAKEPRKIRPVDLAIVEATKPFLSDPLRAIVDLQLATAARAGELLNLTAADLDMSGPLWTYQPEHHKSERFHERMIYFGRRAQEVLRGWLRADQEPLFQPAEAADAYQRRRRQARRTPLWKSHEQANARKRRPRPRRRPGRTYAVTAYGHAIRQAADAADRQARREAGQPVCEACGGRGKLKAPEAGKRPRPCPHCEGSGFVGARLIPRWTSHQLRHTAATAIRKQYGPEAAQVILGHAHLQTTEIYAERDAALARRVMAEVG